MLRKIILTLTVAIPFFGLAFLLTGPPPSAHHENLPWQIEISPEGRSTVFGVELESTPLQNLREQLRLVPSVALFVMPDGSKRLEAYFGSVKLGPFEANLLAVPATDASLLDDFAARAVTSRPTPSGARRLSLSDEDARAVLDLPVRELSYVPRARYDDAEVRRRFGEPVQMLPIGDERRYYLYPQEGLVVVLNSRGRDVLHYVAPRHFDALTGRIMAGETLLRSITAE